MAINCDFSAFFFGLCSLAAHSEVTGLSIPARTPLALRCGARGVTMHPNPAENAEKKYNEFARARHIELCTPARAAPGATGRSCLAATDTAKRPAPRPPKLLELPARAGGARKLRTSSAGGAPPPPSSLRRRGRRTARAQQRRQWVEAKRGASDGRSGAPRAAHRGGMMPVMMAAPSRGCSADSGDSSVKKASARARRRAPPQRRRCRRSANACRATKPGSERGI